MRKALPAGGSAREAAGADWRRSGKVAASARSERLAGAHGDRRRGAPVLGRSATQDCFSCTLQTSGQALVGRDLGLPGRWRRAALATRVVPGGGGGSLSEQPQEEDVGAPRAWPLQGRESCPPGRFLGWAWFNKLVQ